MQSSWDGSQNGTGSENQPTWAGGYSFPSQGGQFEEANWPPTLQSQQSFNHPPTSDGQFYPANVSHGNNMMEGSIGSTGGRQPGFQNQNSLQFQADAGMLGSFDLQDNVFDPQAKLDLDGFGEVPHTQGHQAQIHQGSGPAFTSQVFQPYGQHGDHEQQFQAQAYTQQPQQPQQQHTLQAQPQQALPQQQSHQQGGQQGNMQALESMQPQNYQAHQGFPPRAQHQMQQRQQQQPMAHSGTSFSQPPQQEMYAASPNAFIQPRPQQAQQPQFQQQQFSPPTGFVKTQTSIAPASQGFLQVAGSPQVKSASPAANATPRSITPQGVKRVVEQAMPASQPSPDSSEAAAPAEPAAKKRKKAPPSKVTPQTENEAAPSPTAAKKVDDKVVPSLMPPKPTSTEAELGELAKFKKRTAAAKAKLPPIAGAGYLVAGPTIKLDAQKSHDKLVPLVAMPARSGRRILPELGRDLACEIQGKFSSNYKPSASSVGGLDDRRREATKLLDVFDKSMLDLGKKRPKYTEYPRKSPDMDMPTQTTSVKMPPRFQPLMTTKDGFKEQLKADESARKKTADKQARKMAEEERNKPVRKRQKMSHAGDGALAANRIAVKVRAETRPADAVEGAAWDIIGIVHIDAAANRTTSLLATAVQQAGEYIMSLRSEMNRAKQDLDQAIKDKQGATKVDAFRKASEQKKEALYRALDAANKVGDEAVLENLGGHAKLVTNLVNLLITCIKATDFTGKLPKATLQLMAKFRLSQKVATEKTFETVRKRLADKGDGEVKDLLETIKSRIRKESDVEGSPKKPAPKSGSKVGDMVSAKRNREDDADTRIAKKQALDGPSSSQLLAKPGTSAAASKSAVKPRTAATVTIGGILPGKSRPIAKPIPKLDATKHDGLKAADVAKPTVIEKAATKAEPRKTASKVEGKLEATKAAPKPPPAPSSIGGGIASLLSTINAPKTVEKVASKDSDSEKEKENAIKDESPEAKKKRLRKEERRKLRVSWAPESDLTQIKYFHKDDDESEGFERTLTKDAGDDKSEGLVLKHRSTMDEDDDDEDDIPYRPWLEPTLADFSHIAADYRKRTFVTRGGDLPVSSEEAQFIADREQKVLIAVYPTVDEIPPSANSPLPETAPSGVEAKIAHLPRDDAKFEEVHRRVKEAQQFGKDTALRYAMQRANAKMDPAAKVNSILDTLMSTAGGSTSLPGPSMSFAPSSINPLDPRPLTVSGIHALEQALALLQSDRVRHWVPKDLYNPAMPQTRRRNDYPDPRVQSDIDIVEDVCTYLFGKPYPPTEPPVWLQGNQEATREWWIGFHKDAQARAKKEAEERARAEAEAAASQQRAATHMDPNQQQQQQQQQQLQEAWAAFYAQQPQYAPYFAMLQQAQQAGGPVVPQAVPPPPVTAPAGNDSLQAVLAALGGQSQLQGHVQAPPAPTPNGYLALNDTAYQQAMILAQAAAQQQQPEQHNDYAAAPSDGYGGHDRDRDVNNHGGKDRERDRDRGDRDGRDHGRDKERDRANRGRKSNKAPSGTLPVHRPVNKALIGTKPCVFFKQGNCARGDLCTFRHD